MRIPIVKEWGSWAVFISSWLAALIAGLLARPWESGRAYSLTTALTILGLTFLINSKSPLTPLLRSWKGPSSGTGLQRRLKGEQKGHVLWLLFFVISGLIFLAPFFIEGIKIFSFFSFLVLSYIIQVYRGREHSLLTELNGFALLTLSAPVVYFTVTGELSLKLYVAVLIFFCAGVFKVRVRTRKTLQYRWIMVLYCLLAVIVYFQMNISVIILLPLIENVISVLLMREEKLRATGYTELVKGILFIMLIGLFWR